MNNKCEDNETDVNKHSTWLESEEKLFNLDMEIDRTINEEFVSKEIKIQKEVACLYCDYKSKSNTQPNPKSANYHIYANWPIWELAYTFHYLLSANKHIHYFIYY